VKALTLTEPYATLVLYGWKRYETRSWQTSHRGPLAIHAASTYNGVGGKRAFEALVADLHPGLVARLEQLANPIQFELGRLIGVTWVENCVPVEEVRDVIQASDEEFDWWEADVGNYGDGRYAWELRDPVGFPSIPWKGHQGLWNVPDDVIPEYARLAIRHPA
jgi:hypothetical protein